MAIDVRLTNAQAIAVAELIGKVEVAEFDTQNKLGIDGRDIRTLRNAAVRIMASLVEALPGATFDVTHKLLRVLLDQLKQADREHAA